MARFVELDSIFHQPNWEPLPVPQLRAAVAAIVAADAWVIDGNYSAVRDLIWARADTVVFFDLPRRMVMRQVGWRTARRATTGAELWNGNRESWRNALALHRDESILRWAWMQHTVYRERFRAAMTDPQWSHIDFVRITSRRAGPEAAD
ncbi:MAG: adenylate kinase [Pseudonocardiales bacterium]|nr:MAG: adenylate kinase [Pseudonocardiales bacterium]